MSEIHTRNLYYTIQQVLQKPWRILADDGFLDFVTLKVTIKSYRLRYTV